MILTGSPGTSPIPRLATRSCSLWPLLTLLPPDEDGSGTNEPCVSSTIGSERLDLATPWFKENGKKAVLGETAGASNPTCIEALQNELQYVADNSDVWAGHLLWAAGPWWADCKLNSAVSLA